MNQSSAGRLPAEDVADVDLPADELERLARVDALLRFAAASDLGAGPRTTALIPDRPGGADRCGADRCAQW
jgi:hypothetical protein